MLNLKRAYHIVPRHSRLVLVPYRALRPVEVEVIGYSLHDANTPLLVPSEFPASCRRRFFNTLYCFCVS